MTFYRIKKLCKVKFAILYVRMHSLFLRITNKHEKIIISQDNLQLLISKLMLEVISCNYNKKDIKKISNLIALNYKKRRTP